MLKFVAMTAINHLLNCLYLELFRVSIPAHIHLSSCHFGWLKGV